MGVLGQPHFSGVLSIYSLPAANSHCRKKKFAQKHACTQKKYMLGKSPRFVQPKPQAAQCLWPKHLMGKLFPVVVKIFILWTFFVPFGMWWVIVTSAHVNTGIAPYSRSVVQHARLYSSWWVLSVRRLLEMEQSRPPSQVHRFLEQLATETNMSKTLARKIAERNRLVKQRKKIRHRIREFTKNLETKETNSNRGRCFRQLQADSKDD